MLRALYTICQKDKHWQAALVSRLTAMRQGLAYSANHLHPAEQRMEIFLLLLDDIDDLFHAFRMSLPKLFGFLVSAVIAAGVVASARSTLRDATPLRMKTDP
jgi:hypothetical protein